MDWLNQLLLAFIPLFVGMDPVGLVPLYLGMMQGIETGKRRRAARQAVVPVSPEEWPKFWHHGQWNEFRVRIIGGELPTITTWINGVKFMEWTETEKQHPAQGGIALQVHGGGDLTKLFVRYRNIRVKAF